MYKIDPVFELNCNRLIGIRVYDNVFFCKLYLGEHVTITLVRAPFLSTIKLNYYIIKNGRLAPFRPTLELNCASGETTLEICY